MANGHGNDVTKWPVVKVYWEGGEGEGIGGGGRGGGKGIGGGGGGGRIMLCKV